MGWYLLSGVVRRGAFRYKSQGTREKENRWGLKEGGEGGGEGEERKYSVEGDR
jgi:hypothetical protein